MEKTAVFNLIILDESGSMTGCTSATISGCNETINVAKNLQEKDSDKQKSFLSIFAFQSQGARPSRYIVKNKPVEQVNHITREDYKPDGCTPLLDAIGSTLTDLKAIAETHEDALGVITIITDGYENSSTHYDIAKIRKMISQLKELGWTFNFIGANIDVDTVADDLNIDNRMAFKNDSKGTHDMWGEYSACLQASHNARFENEDGLSMPEKIEVRKKMSKSFFRRGKN